MTPFKFPPPPPPPPKASSNDAPSPYASRGRGSGGRGGGRGGRAGPQLAQQTSQSAPSEGHGQRDAALNNNKRKRGDYAPQQARSDGTYNSHTQQPGSKPKPPRAKAIPAPSVPSFGFALPPVSVVQPPRAGSSYDTAPRKKAKLQLGLTQQQDAQSESEGEDEDVDEEVMLAEQLGSGGIAFEYNDQKISLQTAAEVAAWIKDRRKQFPTKERIAEKAQEATEKRAKELDFLYRVTGKKRKRREEPTNAAPMPTPLRERKPSLDELRAKVQQSIAVKRRESDAGKPQAVDLGLGYASDSASSSGYSILDEESSMVSSSEESDDNSSEDSDADSAPEEVSSRVQVPVPVAPPPPPPPPQKLKKGVCESWERTGRCRLRRKCGLQHPPRTRAEEKPMTLFERLVEQEKEKADRLALDAIKWLGQNGFLG
ncbi:hypothetical protein M011DRAFT_517238 [Sporormia fimetaria CBS 119925]|uniref:C3H1-type domain-containing protein n=1 Tax=Sporormia fimetaria CBS 119925 TaxID=1340428 RepID=A0A6A6VLJ5_9PLEO|nr:hypothetical protein M011DRAFT_517238 [Sporormia fimetaria CBS 119925]